MIDKSPYFIYIDYSNIGWSEQIGVSNQNYWNLIHEYLINTLGPPGDVGILKMTSRWCRSVLNEYGPGGPPKGVYIRDADDAFAFMLKFPTSRPRHLSN